MNQQEKDFLMTTIDRYVLQLFFKVAIVCSVSMIGLFVVIDLFEHLEDFIDLSKTEGGLPQLIVAYYGPRALSFFDRTSGLLALVSGIFVITLLKRNRELEAIMAGGIPLMRVVRPIFVGVLVIAGLSVANREMLIPACKDRLTREANNWRGEKEIAIRPRYDYETDIFIAGKSGVAADQKILSPIFQLPGTMKAFGSKILAGEAFRQAANANHPAGYLLQEVTFPHRIDQRNSVNQDGDWLILTPKDTSWLKPGECFVVSKVDFKQLTETETEKQFSSTAELINGLHKPSPDYGAQTRVAVHSRFVQPLLDLSLLFVGIPIVITRRDRNIYTAIAAAMGLLAGFFLLNMTCHSLGGYGLIRPALAAWIPVFVLVPFAWTFSRGMK
jgi:lipopolysaccharide export system permease protein